MNSLVKVIVIPTIIQLVIIFDMGNSIIEHTSRLVLEHRNDIQHQFADERQQMKSFVMTTVEREVSKAMHNQNK